MGCVFIVVFVVCRSTCVSSGGVCKLGVRVAWLCMHMIDVSEGSTYW